MLSKLREIYIYILYLEIFRFGRLRRIYIISWIDLGLADGGEYIFYLGYIQVLQNAENIYYIMIYLGLADGGEYIQWRGAWYTRCWYRNIITLNLFTPPTPLPLSKKILPHSKFQFFPITLTLNIIKSPVFKALFLLSKIKSLYIN